MNVVMIYFYSKRFRFAPSFDYKLTTTKDCLTDRLGGKEAGRPTPLRLVLFFGSQETPLIEKPH